MADPLWLAAVAREYRDVMRFRSPPALVQAALFGPLAALADGRAASCSPDRSETAGDRHVVVAVGSPAPRRSSTAGVRRIAPSSLGATRVRPVGPGQLDPSSSRSTSRASGEACMPISAKSGPATSMSIGLSMPLGGRVRSCAGTPNV